MLLALFCLVLSILSLGYDAELAAELHPDAVTPHRLRGRSDPILSSRKSGPHLRRLIVAPHPKPRPGNPSAFHTHPGSASYNHHVRPARMSSTSSSRTSESYTGSYSDSVYSAFSNKSLNRSDSMSSSAFSLGPEESWSRSPIGYQRGTKSFKMPSEEGYIISHERVPVLSSYERVPVWEPLPLDREHFGYPGRLASVFTTESDVMSLVSKYYTQTEHGLVVPHEFEPLLRRDVEAVETVDLRPSRKRMAKMIEDLPDYKTRAFEQEYLPRVDQFIAKHVPLALHSEAYKPFLNLTSRGMKGGNTKKVELPKEVASRVPHEFEYWRIMDPVEYEKFARELADTDYAGYHKRREMTLEEIKERNDQLLEKRWIRLQNEANQVKRRPFKGRPRAMYMAVKS